MPKIRLLFFLLLGACSFSGEGERETDAPPRGQFSEEEAFPLESAAPTVKKLFGPKQGQIQGISLGDSLAKVRSQMGQSPQIERDSLISFTDELSKTEIYEILFYLEAERVRKIRIETFLDNRRSLDTLWQQVSDYLGHQFETSSPGDSTIRYRGKDTLRVILRRNIHRVTPNMKDYGLKVDYLPPKAPEQPQQP